MPRTKFDPSQINFTLGQQLMVNSQSVALASDQTPVPIVDPDTVATGNITATDAVVAAPAGDGSLRSGVPTTNSTIVAVMTGGDSSFMALLTGTFGGCTYWFEGSLDSTNGTNGNWVTLWCRQVGVNGSLILQGAVSAGVYRGGSAGMKYVRVRATGATTPNVAVNLLLSGGPGPVYHVDSLTAGVNKIGTVDIATAVATAKGTQGANAIPVQSLRDAGRQNVCYFMTLPILSTATDALMSLTGYVNNAAVTATTTPAVVPAGKTFRVTAITATYVAVATAGTVKFSIRFNTAGVVAIGSPVWTALIIGGPAAAAGVATVLDIGFPEGTDFPAAGGIGVSMVGLSATQAAAAVGYGQIAIYGYYF